jgi:hypothetical protein
MKQKSSNRGFSAEDGSIKLIDEFCGHQLFFIRVSLGNDGLARYTFRRWLLRGDTGL